MWGAGWGGGRARRLFPPQALLPHLPDLSLGVRTGQGEIVQFQSRKRNGGRRGGEAGWWLSKVLNLELKLGWEGRQFSPLSTDHPPAFLPYLPQTGTRHNLGCVTLIQARSCKSLTFSMSVSLYLFIFFWGKEMLQSSGSRPQSTWPLRPTSASWILPYTPPAEPCPRVGRLSRTPPLCCAKNLLLPPVTHPQPERRTVGPLLPPPRALLVLLLYWGSGSS